jgi:ribonuclease-3
VTNSAWIVSLILIDFSQNDTDKQELQFDTISEENQGGFWKYTMMVLINNKKYGMGTGSSKKLAEQAASKETLELMGAI